MNQQRIVSQGKVIFVEPTYAYIESSRGTIFVAPSSLQIEAAAPITDLTRVLPLNAPVAFTAVYQDDVNSCNWRATCVKLLLDETQACDIGSDLKVGLDAVVTKVFPTYAFLWCEELACTVFFPGTAFDFNKQSRLQDCFQVNDKVVVTICPQTEANGCRWRALSVQLREEDATSPPAARAIEGMVSKLFPQYGFIFHPDYGTAFFTAANMVNSDLVRIEDLTKILALGDVVSFEPVPQAEKNNCRWRAVNVTKQEAGSEIVPRTAPSRHKRVSSVEVQTDSDLGKSDATAQTLVRVEDLVWRAIRDDPALLQSLKEKCPAVAQYAETATF